MLRTITAPCALIVVGLSGGLASAEAFEAEVAPLLESSCLKCHGERTKTPLNLAGLGVDLADPQSFRSWQRVFDRVVSGEMPPASARRPDAATVDKALESLKRALVEANLEARAGQRTPLRRLTRLEYQNTIQDLLQIDETIAAAIGQTLPAEADSGGFDTVAAKQGISPLHVRSYLDAADQALDAAIALGPRPDTVRRKIEYTRSSYLDYMHEAEILGGGVTKKLDDAVVMFFDVGSTYLMHTQSEGFTVPYPGRYHVTMEAYPYQADTPVTLTLFRGTKPGAAAALNDLLGSWDLVGDTARTIELETFLRPGELLSPSVADLVVPPNEYTNYFAPDQNVKDYKGEGVAMKSLSLEGPLLDTWPPLSTRELLVGVDFDEAGEIQLTKAPYEHVADIVASFAPRAFRRPLEPGELEAYASLAEPFLADGAPFVEALRVPLRAILTAPPFLYHMGSPGPLDGFALATRLSYFLWRSMPDDELAGLAGAAGLSDPQVIAEQVDRLLDDPRSERFIRDFVGQAFRLYEMKATTPDPALYPEYDSRLGQAMTWETELFLAELVGEDLGAGHLIDADFTFLNRRLAEHYDIEGIAGQQMRKVDLPAQSPRGGLLTQGSIHKITANGTTTSPVPRGNFVLANLLGKPAPPPPAGVEGLEPDTRGATTIREQLDAHRSDPVCNSCHRTIDPPGFALEAFDPIGGFRTSYRASGGEVEVEGVKYPAPYREGPEVDTTGVTPQGQAFSGIEDYKRLLLESDVQQVAHNLVSQLLVYSTGAEIEFADRDEVERIVARLADHGYPIRTMIREVVQSDLFRSP
jgi:hypothetical protein